MFVHLAVEELVSAGARNQTSAQNFQSSSGAFVSMGCFEDSQIVEKGISSRPMQTAGHVPQPWNVVAASTSCSVGCAAYSYFRVRQAAGDGWCLCGNLRAVSWKRDKLGMAQLKRLAISAIK